MYVTKCDNRQRAGRRLSQVCGGGGIPLVVGVGAPQFVQGVFPGQVFIDVPPPAGIQHGDLAYIITQQRADWIPPSGLAWPSDWTRTTQFGVSSGNTVCIVLRKYIPADQGSVRLTYTDTNSTQDHLQAAMIVVRGVQEAAPDGIAASTGTGLAIQWGPNATPYNTLGANRLVIGFITCSRPDVDGSNAFVNYVNASLANLTERLDVSKNTFVGAGMGLVTGERAVAGGVTRGTVDTNPADSTATICSEIVVIKPKG